MSEQAVLSEGVARGMAAAGGPEAQVFLECRTRA